MQPWRAEETLTDPKRLNGSLCDLQDFNNLISVNIQVIIGVSKLNITNIIAHI